MNVNNHRKEHRETNKRWQIFGEDYAVPTMQQPKRRQEISGKYTMKPIKKEDLQKEVILPCGRVRQRLRRS